MEPSEAARHKTSGKTERKLVVRYTPCVQTLVRVLQATRGIKPLFVHSRGMLWTKHSAARRIARLKADSFVDGEFTLYSYCYTFATGAFEQRLSVAYVAALLRHSSMEIVSRVYRLLGNRDSPQEIRPRLSLLGDITRARVVETDVHKPVTVDY